MQPRGLLDKVLQFMGIQEDDEDDEHTKPEMTADNGQAGLAAVPNVDLKKRPKLVSITGQGHGPTNMKVSVVYPKAYEDVQSFADHLKARQPIIVSLDGVDADLSRRIIDFMSGVTYALEGRIHRIGDGIFLIAPVNVMIDASESLSFSEKELFE